MRRFIINISVIFLVFKQVECTIRRVFQLPSYYDYDYDYSLYTTNSTEAKCFQQNSEVCSWSSWPCWTSEKPYHPNCCYMERFFRKSEGCIGEKAADHVGFATKEECEQICGEILSIFSGSDQPAEDPPTIKNTSGYTELIV